jgi:hypothetical protein
MTRLRNITSITRDYWVCNVSGRAPKAAASSPIHTVSNLTQYHPTEFHDVLTSLTTLLHIHHDTSHYTLHLTYQRLCMTYSIRNTKSVRSGFILTYCLYMDLHEPSITTAILIAIIDIPTQMACSIIAITLQTCIWKVPSSNLGRFSAVVTELYCVYLEATPW